MARLPLLSGRDVVRALETIGYRSVRQRGSHIRLVSPGRKSVTVPDHKIIGRGLLRKILRDAELSLAEFLRIIK